MTKKEVLEKDNYQARTEGWPKRIDGGITVYFMGKISLSYSGEPPILYIAERRGLQGAGITEQLACIDLIKIERQRQS
jgi:hypothetical protein